LLVRAAEPDRGKTVELVEPVAEPLGEIAATLLYAHDYAGHSYRQVLDVVGELSMSQKREILELSLGHRGPHDELLREHQSGYAVVFDVLIDLGSFRDLHRHRRCVQIQQPYTWEHGFETAAETFVAGLGPEAAQPALAAGLGESYAATLAQAAQQARVVAAVDRLAAHYLLPLAYRTRCLFKMDWAQAAYMIELRTGTAGHFSYRRAAWEMYQQLRARHPMIADTIRATPPRPSADLLSR
jgi:hypothetical protein